jgi:hypothetical protein
MKPNRFAEIVPGRRLCLGVLCLFLAAIPVAAQFSGNIQGVVQDPTQAVIPGAAVKIRNLGTQVEWSTTTGPTGVYRFTSLPPGRYEVTGEAQGFQPRTVIIDLLTAQTADVSLRLEIRGTGERVVVIGEAPVLNPADSRTHATIDETSLDDLPLPNRNMLGLAAVAPGVTGLGTVGGGAPGDAPDNFSTETTVDVSGNGRNSSGNQYTLDGLNVTSNIIQGVANLAPNPDSIQEIAVQTNTFTVEHGRASSVQVAITTKSGTNEYHGSASYYFNNQKLFARTVFTPAQRPPFKKHLFNATAGGPLIKNKTFWFGSVESLRSQTSSADVVRTFESPDFVNWAKRNFPNTIGTKILSERFPVNIGVTATLKYARDIFGTGAEGCDTQATSFIPCDLPMILEGRSRPSPFRNALQWNLRGDQYLNNNNDRLYFNLYKTDLDLEDILFREGFSTVNDNFSTALQANWTHTFSPTLLNEFNFGWIFVQGNRGLDPSIPMQLPSISIVGQNLGIAPTWGPATFIQNNWNWRNVVSLVRGPHSLKFGFEAWTGDDDARFNDVNGRTSFTFNNLLDLVKDDPFLQSGPLIDPLTGKEGPGGYEHLLTTFAWFVQDEWKVKPNLTLTFGLRWDDYGNITRNKEKGVALANVFLPKPFGDLKTPQEVDQAFANAVVRTTDEGIYDGRVTNNWSPRFGFAWDPRGNGKWAVRGGVGLYHDWIPLGEANRVRGNPPGLIGLNLRRDGPIKPVFSIGTNNRFPYGWVLPQLPTLGVDERGGLAGLNAGVGGIDRFIRPADSYIYNVGVERQLPSGLVAGAMYSGSRTRDGIVGHDFNRFAGDLLDGKLDRLNPSFGPIFYERNANKIDYNAMVLSLRGRFSQRGSFQMSYTLSKVEDLGQSGSRVNRDPGIATPSQHNLERFKAPADWDVRQRFALVGLYTVPAPTSDNPFVKNVLGGWELTSLTIVQSGRPFNVFSGASFQPLRDAAGNVVGYKPGSGDFNADGVNWDFPNMPAQTLPVTYERQQYLSGLFKASDFPLPEPGTLGNFQRHYFRGPGFWKTDFAVLKNNTLGFLGEQGKLQLRFEFFNIFNRVNLFNPDGNLASASFGRTGAQYDPRIIQLGARIVF